MAYNTNRFEQIGRVARINEFDTATKVVIASDRRMPNGNGATKKHTSFNSVTIFAKATREYIHEHIDVGDQVGCHGYIETGSYEKDGVTVYGVDLIASQFGLLSKKRESED